MRASRGTTLARILFAATSAAALASLMLLAPACSRNVGSFLGPNEPPQLEIVDARAIGSAGVRVRWAARDPGGRLAATHWRLDPWVVRAGDAGEEHATTLEECVIAPALLTSTRATAAGAVREPQRFTVWAVDAAGARSEPATLALYANNVAPIVNITSPQPSSLLRAQVPPSVCIQWTGIDPDGVNTQKPVKYKFELLDLDDPANQVYLANPDSLRRVAVATNWAGWDSTSADTEHKSYTNLVPNKSYLFTVTGWDEAGDYDPVFSLTKNMLQFFVNYPGNSGPLITVTGPAFQFMYESPGVSHDPVRIIHTEVAAAVPVPFQWSARPSPGQQVTGYRWVLDPIDWHDETPRSGPGDLRHWTAWGPTTSVALGPYSQAGPKREEHTLFIEARSDVNDCTAASVDEASLAMVHFVVVKPTLDKDLLIVDDTRLEPDKFFVGNPCQSQYTQKWPSAAELDTFLYARGGVPWRCTLNPSSGVTSIPGLFAGYAFDTLGTRGMFSGRVPPGGQQTQALPLSVLASYRHVLWLTDGPAATFNDPNAAVNPATAMRFMSEQGMVNVLTTYVKMGGKLWLAGGGTATASLLPWNKHGNDAGGITVFSSLPQWNEVFPSQLVWEGPHLRSEISVSSGATQATRALGRFEPAPGSYGAFPPTLDSRTVATDPLPPTRLTSQSSLFYYTSRPAEFLTQPNVVLEGGVSVLDSLYTVQGASLPSGTGNVAMTVYHGSEGGECIWTGFDLWSFQRSETIQFVDAVLQGTWGLPRDPVLRGPAGAPVFVSAGAPPRPPANRSRALRLHY